MSRHARSLCWLSYASRIPPAGKRSTEALLSISTSDGNSPEYPADALSLPECCKVHVAASLLQLLPCKLIFITALRVTLHCRDGPWFTSFVCHCSCPRIPENTSASLSSCAFWLEKDTFPSPGSHGQMSGEPQFICNWFLFPRPHALLSHPFSFKCFFMFLNEKL